MTSQNDVAPLQGKCKHEIDLCNGKSKMKWTSAMASQKWNGHLQLQVKNEMTHLKKQVKINPVRQSDLVHGEANDKWCKQPEK